MVDGRPYRFYVSAFNRMGGVAVDSPIRSVIAATVPEEPPMKPVIADVDTDTVSITWSLPPNHPSPSGSPVTGYKVYQFDGVALNSAADPYPVKREIQQIYTIVDTPQSEIQTITTTSVTGVNLQLSTAQICTHVPRLNPSPMVQVWKQTLLLQLRD